MLKRILNAVLAIAFVALLCGYVCLVFADKPKAHLEVLILRDCLEKIELQANSKCTGPSEKDLTCGPVTITRKPDCTITRVVK